MYIRVATVSQIIYKNICDAMWLFFASSQRSRLRLRRKQLSDRSRIQARIIYLGDIKSAERSSPRGSRLEQPKPADPAGCFILWFFKTMFSPVVSARGSPPIWTVRVHAVHCLRQFAARCGVTLSTRTLLYPRIKTDGSPAENAAEISSRNSLRDRAAMDRASEPDRTSASPRSHLVDFFNAEFARFIMTAEAHANVYAPLFIAPEPRHLCSCEEGTMFQTKGRACSDDDFFLNLLG